MIRYQAAWVSRRTPTRVEPEPKVLGPWRPNEQALVFLPNREIVDASRGRTFHCKMANNRFFLLIVLA